MQNKYLTLSPSYRPVPPFRAPPYTSQNRLPGLPLTPAEIAFNEDLHRRFPTPCSIDSVIAHIKWWRCIRWRWRQCSQIISAHVSDFQSHISGRIVSFWSSLGLHSFEFRRVLTAARQQWTPDSDSELDFDGFVTVEFGENGHFAANLLRKRCGLTSSWLGCPMATVIRVTLTALLLRCPWQQWFFDIQTSANLRKLVLSFVSSISLKNRMPVIPFPSERVFDSATYLPMLIPLKTLRNFWNLHLKIYSG